MRKVNLHVAPPKGHLVCVLSVLRYKVAYKKERGECQLEISMTFADDAGEYAVFAKNPHGEASASASLLEEGIHFLSARGRYWR